MQIAVLMPCFNAARELRRAVQSILAQTYRSFELVAIDDGSSDDTLDLLQAMARHDRRMRVISRPHAGIVETLNAGLGACRAPLIARMDSDDVAHPERLALQVAHLRANPDLAAVGCMVRGFPRGYLGEGYRIYFQWLNGLITPQDIAREIFIESPLAHPSVLIRREWLERVGGYQDHGWAEDYDLWLRIHLAGGRFGKVERELMLLREHPQRLTRTDSRYSVENFLRAKARYLALGPLKDRQTVFLWGAGQIGRRLSKHLHRRGVPLSAFIDVDPSKIGRTRRGLPIIAPHELLAWWQRSRSPVLLSAVASRGARALIRQQLAELGLQEGQDWWAVA